MCSRDDAPPYEERRATPPPTLTETHGGLLDEALLRVMVETASEEAAEALLKRFEAA